MPRAKKRQDGPYARMEKHRWPLDGFFRNLDRCYEAISLPRDRFYETGIFCVVFEGRSNLFDTGVDAEIEVDVRVLGPELLFDFLAGNDAAGSLSEEFQHTGRLRMKLDGPVVFAKLTRFELQRERTERTDCH